MSRTKGSGWGGGPLLYQKCPFCNRKKAIYQWVTDDIAPFFCTSCKVRFHSSKLLRYAYASQLSLLKPNNMKYQTVDASKRHPEKAEGLNRSKIVFVIYKSGNLGECYYDYYHNIWSMDNIDYWFEEIEHSESIEEIFQGFIRSQHLSKQWDKFLSEWKRMDQSEQCPKCTGKKPVHQKLCYGCEVLSDEPNNREHWKKVYNKMYKKQIIEDLLDTRDILRSVTKTLNDITEQSEPKQVNVQSEDGELELCNAGHFCKCGALSKDACICREDSKFIKVLRFIGVLPRQSTTNKKEKK